MNGIGVRSCNAIFNINVNGIGVRSCNAIFNINEAGEYHIQAHWTQHANRATNAPYIIAHANGTDTITVNQQANGGQYVSLGTWTLDANSTVTLTDQANGYVIADALRFVGETAGAPEPVQGGLFYVHTDHLGTPQKLTDDNQQIVWDAVYEPFGQVIFATELVTFNLRFPGQYFDQETGLHYNYFRDYDPTIGRYVQSDPIGLDGGLNTYAYVGGNPLTYSDPLGLKPRGEWINSTPSLGTPNLDITGAEFISPRFDPFGYLYLLRIYGTVSDVLNASVKCIDDENCSEWEMHNIYPLTVSGHVDVGPNIYATGAGLVARNPWVTFGANVVLALAKMGHAASRLYAEYGQAGSIALATLLSYGPNYICENGFPALPLSR